MPLPPRPRALLFDAGNTLLRMNYGAIAGELERHGIAVTADALEHAERRARVRLDREVLAAGASTESADTTTRYLAYTLAGVGITDAAIVAALAEWRLGYNRPIGLFDVLDPAAPPALALARAAGVATGVVSNSNGSVRMLMERLGLAPSLDFVLDSFDLGFEKPDPRIFRLALERAGAPAEDAVYFGDLYSVDVLGARRVGIAAVLIDPDGCWDACDCPRAPDVLAAVRLALEGPGAPPSGDAGAA